MGDEKAHYKGLLVGMPTMRFSGAKRYRFIPTLSPKGRGKPFKSPTLYKKMSRLYIKDGSSKHEFSNYTKSQMSVGTILSCAQTFIH